MKILIIIIALIFVFAMTGGINSIFTSISINENPLRYNGFLKQDGAPIKGYWKLGYNAHTKKYIVYRTNEYGTKIYLYQYKHLGVFLNGLWETIDFDEDCQFDSPAQARYYFNIYRRQQIEKVNKEKIENDFR